MVKAKSSNLTNRWAERSEPFGPVGGGVLQHPSKRSVVREEKSTRRRDAVHQSCRSRVRRLTSSRRPSAIHGRFLSAPVWLSPFSRDSSTDFSRVQIKITPHPVPRREYCAGAVAAS